MKLPQLSLPWAILASVVIAALTVLLVLHVVSWPTLAAFIGGVLVPALKSDAKAPAVPPLPVLIVGGLIAVGVALVACTKQETSKTEYGAQVKACVEVSHNRAEFEACFHGVQIKWDEAGAPPALVFAKDGGDQ